MPPSEVSLKRSRKVPDTIFFSSRRSWLRLTKPMMRLEETKPVRPKVPAPLVRIRWTGRRQHQVRGEEMAQQLKAPPTSLTA